MQGAITRVQAAFAHRTPDRTPLFEIFCAYHPIHWAICGRTVGTDQALCWDAMAEGIAWPELLEAHAQAAFQVNHFFGLDMVRLNGAPARDYGRLVKTGPTTWTRDGVEYALNPRTCLVELAHPGEQDAYSRRVTEEEMRAQIEAWDGSTPTGGYASNPLTVRVRELADAAGVEWIYMGEIGAGTGVAFYPPFMLEWMLTEPELYQRWLERHKRAGIAHTRAIIADNHAVIAMGGDVSSDKGPFISPALYHEFILPAIQEHVAAIHEAGALAVYTSDGNHWAIKNDFFFNSHIDGYKEVDQAAGMTFDRLIAEGIKDRVCIIGNIDARFSLCLGTPAQVHDEVIACLRNGQQTPGGHILHNSHSVHEDVKAANYYATVNAYRDFFGLERLPE